MQNKKVYGILGMCIGLALLVSFMAIEFENSTAHSSGHIVPEDSTFFATVFVEENSSYETNSDGDLWPSAWSDDDHVYTANGDGYGFASRPNLDWRDIAMNKLDVSGHPDTQDVDGEQIAYEDDLGQVWSDPNEYNRKPTGMVSVNGDLYLAVQDLNSNVNTGDAMNDAPAATIAKSTDKGQTWTWDTSAPMFDNYEFTTIMFLDYGKDSQNNTFDNYVYAYGLDYNWRDSFSDTVTDPTKLYLARMPKTGIQDKSTWEFYTGDLDGNAQWSNPGMIGDKQPVLQDDRRVYTNTLHDEDVDDTTVISQGSIVYNQPLDRYIYTSWTEYTFEFYEAPNPWGPWKKFISKDFGVYPWNEDSHGGYATVIPSKYISGDGKTMWMNSNTFMGDVDRYHLSFRKLNVTPWESTTPQNLKSSNNLALPQNSQDVTPGAKYSLHFGQSDIFNNEDKTGSEDTWNGLDKTEEWWGYTWSHAYHINEVAYTTGTMFSGDGGWFKNNLRVQVRQNFNWVDVTNLSVSPDYPYDDSAGSNETYTFTFDDTWGDGVRIIGIPGGPATFTSLAELEVYYE